MKVKITRIESGNSGVFGALSINDEAFCVTLEPEDLNNKINISCIPKGVYLCERVVSPRFGSTFEVTSVPGRSHILFHAGNTEDNTEGCIILAQYFGKLRGERAVLNSGKTFREFMTKFEEVNYFVLHIVDTYE